MKVVRAGLHDLIDSSSGSVPIGRIGIECFDFDGNMHWTTHLGGRFGRALLRLDERLGRWPVARNSGDHFLMVLTKR